MSFKPLLIFLCIWIAFAFVGGIADGKLFTDDNLAQINRLNQAYIASEAADPLDAVPLIGEIRYVFAVGQVTLQTWASVMTFNFSFVPNEIRAVAMTLMTGTLLTLFAIALFGRR